MTQAHNPNSDRRKPRDSRKYNAASTRESSFFEGMVPHLVQIVEEPARTGPGRPPIPRKQMMTDIIRRVHDGRPSRKFISDLDYSVEQGVRDEHVEHFNIVTKYMRETWVTDYLYQMLEMTAHPLRHIEPVVAVDSTGFICRPPGHWNHVKHGSDGESKKVRRKRRHRLRRGVKAHIISGVNSNIIMAAAVTHINASDHDALPELLDQTLKHCEVKELLGDGAYMSHHHFAMLSAQGILPFIPFASHVVTPPLDGTMWSKMYHLVEAHADLWHSHYNLRNNVETTYSMVKGGYGEYLLSRNTTAQTNEVLLKFVCHNIWVLNQQAKTIGIDPLDLGVEVPSLTDTPVNGTNGTEPMAEVFNLPHHQPCICPECFDRESNRPVR